MTPRYATVSTPSLWLCQAHTAGRVLSFGAGASRRSCEQRRFVKSLKALTMVVSILIPAAILSAKPSVHLTHPPPGRYGVEDLWKARVRTSPRAAASFPTGRRAPRQVRRR